MLTNFRRPAGYRRGVTLVEMLVVVALVILMMVILVQIFQSATGAMSASRAIQDLDLTLRQLDQRLKQDLIGVTAKFTPPLDPSLKLGYFEYGENALSDLQGEDSDDYLAFTTKAPEGQVFTGRCFIRNPGQNQPNAGNAANLAVQPVTITSQLAEVIYFMRNGNLYRRVFLIVPDRQGSITTASIAGQLFPALSPTVSVSWIGVNDVSARPAPTGSQFAILLNDLGSLTNRENRAFRPRFRSDYFNNASITNGAPIATPDGIDEDSNGDDVPDLYPTLYPNAFSAGLVHEYPNSNYRQAGLTTLNTMPFPFIFPGMFSQPETVAPYSTATGVIHSLDPSHSTYLLPDPITGVPTTSYPYTGNHNPLRTGDNLATPNPATANQTQTWWGFPTWRETLSKNWYDPGIGPVLGTTPTQQPGLVPVPAGTSPAATYTGYLPKVTSQLANDGAGVNSLFSTFVNAPGVWDDDLICTNVRSFDVKAYDPSAPLYLNSTGYYDLGYGIQNTPTLANTTPVVLWDASNQPQGFGHAGRIPPLSTDHRLNPSRPSVGTGINNNGVGDDTASTIRLTRVWDTWSTDYTNAPGFDVFYNGYPGTNPGLPVYPSYPAPYTSPLRGIQIKIRVNDPRGDYVKDLTIRHDFTDKL